MNYSKQTDPRFWERWQRAGAVGDVRPGLTPGKRFITTQEKIKMYNDLEFTRKRSLESYDYQFIKEISYEPDEKIVKIFNNEPIKPYYPLPDALKEHLISVHKGMSNNQPDTLEAILREMRAEENRLAHRRAYSFLRGNRVEQENYAKYPIPTDDSTYESKFSKDDHPYESKFSKDE